MSINHIKKIEEKIDTMVQEIKHEEFAKNKVHLHDETIYLECINVLLDKYIELYTSERRYLIASEKEYLLKSINDHLELRENQRNLNYHEITNKFFLEDQEKRLRKA
jgi:hypothetical protein